jgi:hypothetical protein
MPWRASRLVERPIDIRGGNGTDLRVMIPFPIDCPRRLDTWQKQIGRQPPGWTRADRNAEEINRDEAHFLVDQRGTRRSATFAAGG